MYKRYIITQLEASLSDFAVVLLIGARQVGKSTLAKSLVAQGIFEQYVTLDDLATLESARQDPQGFIANLPKPVVIDEIQRAPELFLPIKAFVDNNKTPGAFLLTGSANILSLPKLTDSLAGRMDIVHLEGLSLGEIQSSPKTNFIDALFESSSISDVAKALGRQHKTVNTLIDLIFYGGFPEVVSKQSPRFSERWFAAYHAAYIERDIRDLARMTDVVAFGKLFRLAGSRTGNLLNIQNISIEAAIDQRTCHRYLELLQLTFQTHLMEPWSTSIAKRLVKTPKIFLNDSGQACFMLGISSPEALDKHHFIGSIFETWIFAELRKLLALQTGYAIYFYRTHQGREVDFVIEKGKRLCGIEVKLAQTVGRNDFLGLKDLQEAHKGETFGILLYTGNEILPFGENLLAVPIGVLG